MKNSFKSLKKQQGVTLVEIMVSITISLILLGGVIQIFVNNKQTYRTQEALSRVQENGRFAMDFLAREIRMADFWGCRRTATLVVDHLNPAALPAINPVNPAAGGIGGTNNTGLNGSDTLILQGAFGDPLPVVAHDQGAAIFTVTDNSSFDNFNMVIASDCSKADLFEVVSVNADGITIVGDTSGVATGPGNATTPLGTYNGTGSLYRVQMLTYAIRNGASGEPALFRNDNGIWIELIEGIQDMQILYGEDTDNDQTANRYVAAGAVGLVMANVVSIRITMTLQTLQDLITADGSFGRISRTYIATTSIRNRIIRTGP